VRSLGYTLRLPLLFFPCPTMVSAALSCQLPFFGIPATFISHLTFPPYSSLVLILGCRSIIDLGTSHVVPC
jgi:hypothetical protein